MNARTLIEQVAQGQEPRVVVEALLEGTKVQVVHMPDTVVAKVIHTSGTKVAYLNGQQVRVNLTKQGANVAAEIIPSHGAVLRVVLDELSGAGASRMSLVWEVQQVIIEIL